jgi:EAL domain-containing protein (putative c-di-GMP-specific phosphodiesterase class I)/CHASE2 domain-containing sensor protein
MRMRGLFQVRPLTALRAAADRRRLRRAAKRASRSSEPRQARRRIAAWTVAIALVAGFIGLLWPVEDAFRAVRDLTRLHPADQTVLVVTVDDRSLNAMGVSDPKRSDDAKVLDRLFALGAKRVFFDRAYADPTVPGEDRLLLAAFKRHQGRVVVGAIAGIGQSDGSLADIVPHPLYRDHVKIASMTGYEGPFGLSTTFPVMERVLGKDRKSISAELANFDGPEGSYRVDFSVDYRTIPTVEYVDVLQGRLDRSVVGGKDVIISPSSRVASDFHLVPFRELVPGVMMHVLGAETLKKGFPIDFGWLPAFLLAAVVVIGQAARRQPLKRVTMLFAAALIAAPFALDYLSVNIDVMPALLCLGVGMFQLNRLAQATYHGATGLQRIEGLQASAKADASDVIALKIRNFATISASLTREEIDLLLMKAKTMLRATEPDAQFAFHKDTFVWLRAALPVEDLENHVRGLHALFRTSITIGSHAPDVASSIGLDINREAPLRERTESAIQSAEDAAHGGKIFMISEARVVEDRAWKLQILSELEHAIAQDEVNVAFQPKVSLATGRIIGAEALMRWVHPTRGPIEPAQVVASAEEHNRVDMITRFVLNRALRESLVAIERDRSFTIAVNISALDLRDPLFAQQVEHLVAAYRFPAGNLMLEITETAPIENDATVAQNMAALKQLGVKLSVDDFGSGHASLHYLRQIPADEVKIDRSFVTGMDTSAEDRALVQASIEMIHALGRVSVAEGVENQAVVDLLREMGCDTAQGYFFSRAVPMASLVSQLSRGVKAA